MGNQIDSNGPPVFNNKYNIISQIGEGKTAMVYLAEEIADPTKKVAIKILKKTLKVKRTSSGRNLLSCMATSNDQNLKFAKKEMEIHSKLDHETIVKVIECGEHGKLKNYNNK